MNYIDYILSKKDNVNSSTVFLIENDVNWGGFLKRYLEKKGLTVIFFTKEEDALETFSTSQCNFVITSNRFPDSDGYMLTKHIRETNEFLPIFFVTNFVAKEQERIDAFKNGANDFICKPFSMEELVFRIEYGISKYLSCKREACLVFDLGNISFDYSSRLLYNNNKQIRISTREAQLLLALCKHSGKVIDRSDVLVSIWNRDDTFSSRNMDVYISKLRKILKEHSQSIIINEHGVGFKLLTLNTETATVSNRSNSNQQAPITKKEKRINICNRYIDFPFSIASSCNSNSLVAEQNHPYAEENRNDSYKGGLPYNNVDSDSDSDSDSDPDPDPDLKTDNITAIDYANNKSEKSHTEDSQKKINENNNSIDYD